MVPSHSSPTSGHMVLYHAYRAGHRTERGRRPTLGFVVVKERGLCRVRGQRGASDGDIQPCQVYSVTCLCLACLLPARLALLPRTPLCVQDHWTCAKATHRPPLGGVQLASAQTPLLHWLPGGTATATETLRVPGASRRKLRSG